MINWEKVKDLIDGRLKDYGVDWKLTDDGKDPKYYDDLLYEIMIVLRREIKR